MTCKDCYHYEACKNMAHDTEDFEEYANLTFGSMNNKVNCSLFKDKSKIIELPCSVGDRVYYINSQPKIYEIFVLEFSITSQGIYAIFDADGFGVNIELFGKSLFLTREEAEKALAEMESKK